MSSGARNGWDRTNIDKIAEAITEDDEKKLESILKTHTNIDLNKELDGTYLLHMCVGHLGCIKVLLQHGAHPNVTNEEGKQPIHLAVERDLVEALMYLVLYEADYNAEVKRQNDDTDGMTPLLIALQEDAYSCQDFLHFLGAKIPAESLAKNTNSIKLDKLKYNIIRKGYEDGKILWGRVIVPANSGEPVYAMSLDGTNVDIGFQAYDQSFVIYVRRMAVEYQSSSTRIPEVPIPDGMMLISDIYQYRVDKDVQCDIHVQGIEGVSLDEYNEFVVLHMTDFDQTFNVLKNVNIVSNEDRSQDFLVIKGINVCAYGSSPTVSFGILMRVKTDSFARDPDKDFSVNSTVDKLFAVNVPAGTAPACTEIQIQVLKSTNKENTSDSTDENNGDYGKSSDFLSVIDNSTQTESQNLNSQNDLNIQLPKPEDKKGKFKITVLKCEQGKDGTESENWKEHTNFEVSGKVVECKKASFANYIVVNVTKVGHLIKEFVSELYTRALGNKKLVKLFAMVKEVSTLEYLVHVVLCETDVYQNRLQEWLGKGFKQQECGPTDEFEINTKRTFMLKLKLKNATVNFDLDTLPIQYQGERPKSQNFTVFPQCQETKIASGLCLMFKDAVPEKESFYGKKCITTLALRFTSCKVDCVPPDKFLSDSFIEDVANKTIGIKWFSLGVHLGFGCEELFALQDVDPRNRNAMILYKWRDERSVSLDVKLDNIILATKAAEIPKLKSNICDAVNKFHQDNSELRSWLKKYQRSEQDSSLDFSSLKPKPPSPQSDKFLLFAAEHLGGTDDRLFIELDLSAAEREDNQRDLHFRRCKLLMLARDKTSNRIEFLKKLKCTLSTLGLNVEWMEISECARNWLKSKDAQKEDKESRDLIEKVLYIDEIPMHNQNSSPN